MKIALAGNPNCGKTTLFNELTGSRQYVGNWPGVTVEKKDGRLKDHDDVIVQDLPGVYSLSPYSMEEVVARSYLVDEKPDVILNIIDGTNIDRNLYLTTQLLEIGIPIVVAVNMLDIVRRNGDEIDLEKLSSRLKCPVVGISAIKNEGTKEAVELAIKLAEEKIIAPQPHIFTGSVEHAIAHIEESIQDLDKISESNIRWFAVKLFERDERMLNRLNISPDLLSHIEEHIVECEKEMEDDAESIITNQRYACIKEIFEAAVHKRPKSGNLSLSDKIDRIVTNRFLGIPIFAAIVWFMYYIAVTTVGTWLTDWANDGLFGESWKIFLTDITVPGIPTLLENLFVLAGIPQDGLVHGLVFDCLIGGVGTVLGFVPQIAIVFLFLSFLEDCGYMARIAFIMDRIFRKFGLSGKAFIPIVIGMGCGVPAIMATRTIESERDRRMTIFLTTFLPCSAKYAIIAMFTSAFFGGSSLVATAMYFIGIAAIILGGIALKKTRTFGGEAAPFIMELPAYHMPSARSIFIHTWERVKGYIIKAGTIIFVLCVLLWFLMTFDFRLQVVELNDSILRYIGSAIAWLFAPLGFGTWQGAVASITAELAMEEAVATLAMLAGSASEATDATSIADLFAAMNGAKLANLAALSFMIFNLFNPPCIVAIVTAFREMGSKKLGWLCVAFQLTVGYILAFVTYQLGAWLFFSEPFTAWTAIAIIAVLLVLYLVFRKGPKFDDEIKKKMRG